MSHPLVERLQEADPEERRAACLAAAEDPSAIVFLDALIEALGDPDKKVVRAASDAIVRIGAGQPDTERALRVAMRGDSPTRRWGAAFTLSRLAPPDPGLIPVVVEAMGSVDGDVRWAAARLLVDTGRSDPGVLSVVLGLVRNADDPAVRRMATFCLRELAPDEPAAAHALLEASRDPQTALRRAAFTALAALIDPPREVWGRLAEALASDADPAVRNLSAAAAGELGARDPAALPASLRSTLEEIARGSSESGLRRAASRAIERIGPADVADRVHITGETGESAHES